MRFLSRFLNDQSGATAIEYAMVAGGIALAIIGAVNMLGVSTQSLYAAIQDAACRDPRRRGK
jgi:pilus assembly protein Flp/PilA